MSPEHTVEEYRGVVAAHRLVTVEELEMMSPEERRQLHDERLVTDLSQVAPEFLAEIRANARTLHERREATQG